MPRIALTPHVTLRHYFAAIVTPVYAAAASAGWSLFSLREMRYAINTLMMPLITRMRAAMPPQPRIHWRASLSRHTIMPL